MGKHILVLFVLCVISIIWLREIAHVLHYLMDGYIALSKALSRLIVGGYVIAVIRQSLALMLIPILVTLVPAGIYWLAKRRLMPYLYETLYALAFVMIATLALYK